MDDIHTSIRRDDGDTVPMMQRALLLKSFPGFAQLSAADLTLLASVTSERFFRRGEEMLTPGVPVQRFYFIVEGDVQMYADGEPTQRFEARAAVGGLAALTQDPKGAHAVAIEDTLALEVDREDMKDVFEDSFAILTGVLGAIARTLRQLQQASGGGMMVPNLSSFDPVDPSRPLSLVERMWFLRQSQSYGSMTIETLAEMAADANEVRLSDGDEVWSAGEMADHSLMILAGQLRCVNEAGNSWRLGPGFVVGAIDALATAPRLYDAFADGDVVALKVRVSTLLDMLEDDSDMAMAKLRHLASGVTRLLERLAAARGAEAA